jgi:hypothetical protein
VRLFRSKEDRTKARAQAFESRVAEVAAKDAERKRAAEAKAAERSRADARLRAKAATALAAGPLRLRTLGVTIYEGTVYGDDRPLGPLAEAQAVCGRARVEKKELSDAGWVSAIACLGGGTNNIERRMTVRVTVGGQVWKVTVKGSKPIEAACKEAQRFNRLAESAPR